MHSAVGQELPDTSLLCHRQALVWAPRSSGEPDSVPTELYAGPGPGETHVAGMELPFYVLAGEMDRARE